MLLDVPGAAGLMWAVLGTVELALLPKAWACVVLVTCGLIYGPGSKDECPLRRGRLSEEYTTFPSEFRVTLAPPLVGLAFLLSRELVGVMTTFCFTLDGTALNG